MHLNFFVQQSVDSPFKHVTGIDICQDINESVSVDEKEYYQSFKLYRTKNKSQFRIGDSLVISYKETDPTAFKYDYKPSPSLKSRVIDSEFWIDALNNKGFNVEQISFSLYLKPEDMKKFDIVEEKSQLDCLKKVLQLFEILHVKKDFDISKTAENDWRWIDTLLTAFIDNLPVSITINDISPHDSSCAYGKVQIQGITLALIFVEADNKKYKLYDLFNSESGFFVYDNEEQLSVPVYSHLVVDDYIDIDNLNFDSILLSYQTFFENTPTKLQAAFLNRTNLDMLKMLIAYDKSKKDVLLQTAKQLADWIHENSLTDLDRYHALLNVLQIARRQRDLTKDEMQELCVITENSNVGSAMKVGAYLLLGNQPAAQRHFDKLTLEEQNAFREFPIYVFWQDENRIIMMPSIVGAVREPPS